jgi:hypothetical protein
VNISYDNSGTHALQSLLEILNLQEEETIILNAVKNFALEMSYVSFLKNLPIIRIIMRPMSFKKFWSASVKKKENF